MIGALSEHGTGITGRRRCFRHWHGLIGRWWPTARMVGWVTVTAYAIPSSIRCLP